MPVVQPVIGPDFGKIIQQGLGTFQQVRGIQRQGVETAREDEIRDLTSRAGTDPQAFATLQGLDPKAAAAIQQTRDAEDERFRRERAFTAGRIERLPVNQQIQILDERLVMLKQRGGDPSNTQGLRDLLASGDPEKVTQGQDAILNARIQGEREGFLKPAPGAPEPTTLVRNLIAGGGVPGTPEFQKELMSLLRKPATQITVGGGASEQKELGKLRAQGLQSIRDRADTAQNNIASLDILDNIDVSTGRAEPMKQTLAAWGQSFGINTDKLANVAAGEAFTAEAGKVVLNAMAAQKGPQTESDMRQIRTTVSGLGKTPEANKFINNSARAMSLRAIEQRDFYDNFLAENDTLKGASRAWNTFKRDVPMVSRTRKTPAGLPVFFFEFERDVRAANPDATREQILNAWGN